MPSESDTPRLTAGRPQAHQQGDKVVLTPHDDLSAATFTSCWIKGDPVEVQR